MTGNARRAEAEDVPGAQLLGGTASDHFRGDERALKRRWLPVGKWLDDRCDSGVDASQKTSTGPDHEPEHIDAFVNRAIAARKRWGGRREG